jgi:hypothetical protein
VKNTLETQKYVMKTNETAASPIRVGSFSAIGRTGHNGTAQEQHYFFLFLTMLSIFIFLTYTFCFLHLAKMYQTHPFICLILALFAIAAAVEVLIESYFATLKELDAIRLQRSPKKEQRSQRH